MFGREPGYEPESFGVYFTGGTGAEAVRELLKRVDLEAEAIELRETHPHRQGPAPGARRQAPQGRLGVPAQRQPSRSG